MGLFTSLTTQPPAQEGGAKEMSHRDPGTCGLMASVAESWPVTNERLANMVVKLSEGEPDLTEDFALQLLK